jgi:hypothetical protein
MVSKEVAEDGMGWPGVALMSAKKAVKPDKGSIPAAAKLVQHIRKRWWSSGSCVITVLVGVAMPRTRTVADEAGWAW